MQSQLQAVDVRTYHGWTVLFYQTRQGIVVIFRAAEGELNEAPITFSTLAEAWSATRECIDELNQYAHLCPLPQVAS